MKLISIDVGIRNLAICILEGTNKKNMKINYWEVIDVLAERNGLTERPLCFRCKKPAMWQQFTDNIVACTKHCPVKKNVTKSSLTKEGLGDLLKKVEEMGLQPKSNKKPDLVNAIYTHMRQNTWSKFSGGASVKHAPVLELCGDIVNSLDSRTDHWKGADEIIIENQLDRRMFAVQSMIHTYFTVKGFKCGWISAKHKLDNIITIDDSVTTYRGRKKTGIVHMEALCPADNLAFFLSHKKKDDLADSYLQGLWYIEHH